MVKRLKGDEFVSQASIYGGLAYCSAVSAPHIQGLAGQTQEVLRLYDEMFSLHKLDKGRIVHAFAALDYSAEADDFFSAWNAWLPAGEEPALTAIRVGLEAGKLISLQLYVAQEGEVVRVDLPQSRGKLVKHNKVAYFGGQTAAADSPNEQARSIRRSYDELLAACNLKKENILNANSYLRSVSMRNEEYAADWTGWTCAGHKPAGTLVQAAPLEKGRDVTIEFMFADSTQVEDIGRIDAGDTICRAVKHNGVVYFTGHVCAKPEKITLYEQSAALFVRIEELMEGFGLKRENLIICNPYIRDIDKTAEFMQAWGEWVLQDACPSLSIRGARMIEEAYTLEMSFLIACG